MKYFYPILMITLAAAFVCVGVSDAQTAQILAGQDTVQVSAASSTVVQVVETKTFTKVDYIAAIQKNIKSWTAQDTLWTANIAANKAKITQANANIAALQ